MDIIRRQFQRHYHIIKFLIVGGISFLVDYGLLLTCYRIFKLSLAESTAIAYLSGLCFNFVLNKLWTFDAGHSAKQSVRQAFLYAILVLINLGLTYLIITSLAAFAIHPELSKPVATGVIMVINYVAYRNVIFKKAITIEAIEPYE